MTTKIVLVIGESARSDRFGINNYSRDTTPNLAKQDGVVSFKEAYSLATYTILGVQNIFKIHPYINENTIISAFNKLGFKSAWITMQSFTFDINKIASEANTVITKEQILREHSYDIKDDTLIPYLHNILKNNKDDNQFIVLHTEGSHRNYEDRYTKDFQKYTPTCSDINEKSIFKRVFQRNSCEYVEESGNSYDNTILYTDYVLNEVINELKPYKSMFVYISDHGESLGENGLFVHGHEYATAPKEQVHVPYLVWFSKNLLDKNPNIEKNLNTAKSNASKKVDQSTVIHSLLDCVNIESNLIDKGKSICSPMLSEAIKK